MREIDYNLKMNFKKKHEDDGPVNNMFIMIILMLVLAIIMIWCFYLRSVLGIYTQATHPLGLEVQDAQQDNNFITR